jgi:hypothetical protein
MSIADWATTISGILAVIVAAGASLRWVIKHYLSEMKPNSGSSMRDAIDDIRTNVGDIKVCVAKLEGKFEQHIEEHKN